MKATEQYFPVVLFIMLYKVVLTYECVDEILNCGHSNETYRAVLFCGTIFLEFSQSVNVIGNGDQSKAKRGVLFLGAACFSFLT